MAERPASKHDLTHHCLANVDLRPKTQVRGLFSLSYDADDPSSLDDEHGIGPCSGTRPVQYQSHRCKSASGEEPERKMRTSPGVCPGEPQQELSLPSSVPFAESGQSNPRLGSGHAAFGDSTWRAPRTDFYNLPIENLDWDLDARS